MSYYRIAYVTNESLPTVTEADTQMLTHMNLAFSLIQNGVLDMTQLTNMDLIQNFRRWNPKLRIVLSIGGWEADGFSQAAMTEDSRAAFAASCREVMDQYALDGIDIDWEYPCDDVAGIAADPRDKENFTSLLQAIRDAIGQAHLLSVAMGAGESCVQNTQMDKVSAIVDYVQLMTYDIRNGLTSQSGHHASLGITKGDEERNCTRSVVDMYHNAGVPYEKIVVGAAFYGREFQVETSVSNGLLQPSGPGMYGPSYHLITPEYLKEKGFRQFWDEDAQAAYLWNGTTFVSFESPEAIRLKCEFVREKGLAGIMYWEHGHDRNKVLLSEIWKTLS